MYDRIGFQVRDIDASERFYTAALAPLGHVLCSRDAASAGIGPRDAPALWLYLETAANGPHVHVALRAADRKAVDRFHKAGLESGGRENGSPGLREDYSPKHYAAFLIDPDGNNIDAVCMA
jgi:predicted lactoylglutathione lyase